MNKQQTSTGPGVVLLVIVGALFMLAGIISWFPARDYHYIPLNELERIHTAIDDSRQSIQVTLKFIGAAICFGLAMAISAVSGPRPPVPPTAQHIPVASVWKDDAARQ